MSSSLVLGLAGCVPNVPFGAITSVTVACSSEDDEEKDREGVQGEQDWVQGEVNKGLCCQTQQLL